MGDSEVINLGPTAALQPGTYTFSVPLVGSFLHTLDYYLGPSGDDLLIDFTPAGNIIASGSGTVTVTAVNFEIESFSLSPRDQKMAISRSMDAVTACRYLDPITCHKLNLTMTAGCGKPN